MTDTSVKTAERRFLQHGVSVRAINALMAAVTLLISVALLFTTYRTSEGYTEMRVNTDNFIRWQRSANALQTGSDYLTEQVRCFVETGEREFLDNYFEEAKVTRSRDIALAAMEEYHGTRLVYSMLRSALRESEELMNREYYAMRLKAEAMGGAADSYPEEIRAVALSEEDAKLPAQEKAALARSMVFDKVYHDKKQAISGLTQSCLGELTEELEGLQSESAEQVHTLLKNEKILIIVLIVVTISTMLVTMLLVISPLLRAVVFIRSEQPIPIRGSYEFRFLAKTYNLMYEASREQKEQLAFEVVHDRLTGVYNRSGYDFLIQNTDLETSALLILDVDKFKSINDRYGHEVGDRVLKRVTDVLRHSFRAQDYICRIGGDEFTVILRHVNESAGVQIQKKISHINEKLMQGENGLPPVTVSCGVAFGSQLQAGDSLFRTADAALYRVKNTGGAGCKI